MTESTVSFRLSSRIGTKIVHKKTGRSATITAVSQATSLNGTILTVYKIQLTGSNKTKTIDEHELSRKWTK
jgi:hypothetical protein